MTITIPVWLFYLVGIPLALVGLFFMFIGLWVIKELGKK